MNILEKYGRNLQILFVLLVIYKSHSRTVLKEADDDETLFHGDIRVSKNDHPEIWHELRGGTLNNKRRSRRSAVNREEETWRHMDSGGDIPLTVYDNQKGLVRALPDFPSLVGNWPKQTLEELLSDIAGNATGVKLENINESTLRLSWTLNKIPGHRITDITFPHIKGGDGYNYIYHDYHMFNEYLQDVYRQPDFTMDNTKELGDNYQGIVFAGYHTETWYKVYDLWDKNKIIFEDNVNTNASCYFVCLWVVNEPQLENVLKRNGLQIVYEAIQLFHNVSCVRFRQARYNDKHLVAVKKSNSPGLCWSDVGMLTYKRVQFVTLGRLCLQRHLITHELMHTLGFWHEQNRPDRDEYVDILWDNLDTSIIGTELQFKRMESLRTLQIPYDYKSILHYPKSLFSKNGQPTITTHDQSFQNTIGNPNLSHKDICKINKLYKCAGHLDTLSCDCLDSDSRCGEWGAPLGRCHMDEHIKEMTLKCPRSCNFCCATKGTNPCKVLFQQIGCYKAHSFNMETINLQDSGLKVSSLPCSCAQAAQEKDKQMFAVQRTGHCWTMTEPGLTEESYECTSEKGNACKPKDGDCCVGDKDSVFVYRIIHKKP